MNESGLPFESGADAGDPVAQRIAAVRELAVEVRAARALLESILERVELQLPEHAHAKKRGMERALGTLNPDPGHASIRPTW